VREWDVFRTTFQNFRALPIFPWQHAEKFERFTAAIIHFYLAFIGGLHHSRLGLDLIVGQNAGS
jgi:hypothetical protein